MNDWLTPAAVIAAVGVVSAVVAFARWTGKVDSRLDSFGKLLTELGADIKKILLRIHQRSP